MRGYPILTYSEGRVWFARKLKPVIRTFPNFDLTTIGHQALLGFFLKPNSLMADLGLTPIGMITVLGLTPIGMIPFWIRIQAKPNGLFP